MKSFLGRILSLLFITGFMMACDPDEIIEPNTNDDQAIFGTLEVEFRYKHVWIPVDRIVKVGLHVAETAQLLYQGDYFQSANLTDNRPFYSFRLPPGTYYYEAIIGCLCEGDSCSAGGFPGYQFSQKHTMGKFTIADNELTKVKPTFQ